MSRFWNASWRVLPLLPLLSAFWIAEEYEHVEAGPLASSALPMLLALSPIYKNDSVFSSSFLLLLWAWVLMIENEFEEGCCSCPVTEELFSDSTTKSDDFYSSVSELLSWSELTSTTSSISPSSQSMSSQSSLSSLPSIGLSSSTVLRSSTCRSEVYSPAVIMGF